MESAKRACSSFIYGVNDCIRGMSPILNIIGAQEPDSKRINIQRASIRHSIPQGTIRDKLFQCAVFGTVFWFSNFVFNHLIIQYVFHFLVEWDGRDPNSAGVVLLRRVLYTLFYSTWIIPLLCVSKVMNFIWYQDIADLIFVQSGIKKNTNIKVCDILADLTKTIVLQMCYCLQGYAVYFLPLPAYSQHIWYLFHLSLLTSLYAFEYKWWHLGWSLPRRILNIDRKWPYYLGFGFPLALITTLFESFVDSMIVFATLFPLYVISSAVTSDMKSPIFSYPFHSFKIADSVSDYLIRGFWKLFGGILPFRR